MDKIKKTKEVYGFLWMRNNFTAPVGRWHFDHMQEVVSEAVVRGQIGIDIGSGCGYDTYIMAKNNPSVKIVSMDISSGVYNTKEITSSLNNVQVLKGSVLNIPLKNGIFDFAYSFGVLHHTSDPKKGLMEIARVLKKNSPAFLYLYENHSENTIKFIAVKIITILRYITVKMPARFLYILSWLFSPLIFIIFALPARILSKFSATRLFVSKIPFNFGSGFFSLRGSLYDRFSAPIEYRLSRQGVCEVFNECGFSPINITRLNNSAGWVAWGYKEGNRGKNAVTAKGRPED